MNNPLNGASLCVVSIGRDHTDHVVNMTHRFGGVTASETLCGEKVGRRNPIREFPMDAKRACAACVVELANAAIGNETLAPPEPAES